MEILGKAYDVIYAFINIMKTIFTIFQVDEPDFDLTGPNLDSIFENVGTIVTALGLDKEAE